MATPGWYVFLNFEHPNKADGAALWRLARDAGGLDLNSPYAYLMMCQFYRETCVVARDNGKAAGFIVGFRPPESPRSHFVWQIGVAPEFRGEQLGQRMLAWLLAELAPRGVTYLEASVTPSDIASLKMFRGLARQLRVPCVETVLFPTDMFPNPKVHEEEVLLRIGPYRQSQIRATEQYYQSVIESS